MEYCCGHVKKSSSVICNYGDSGSCRLPNNLLDPELKPLFIVISLLSRRQFAMWKKSQRVMRGVFVLASGLTFFAAGAAPFSAGPVPVPWLHIPATRAELQGPAARAKHPAHFDHNPKHGGIFFMSMDNKHHLEGVLVPPGTFRLYLYDEYTRPLTATETRKTSGTVQIGDSESAPKINLVPGKKAETLVANLGNGVKFPVALTVLLRLPGMSAKSRPELFNFTFKQFTHEPAPRACNPMPNMPGMRC
jgi:hypothetical protein